MFNPVEPRLIATANSKEGVGLWDIRKPRRLDLHRLFGLSAIFSDISISRIILGRFSGCCFCSWPAGGTIVKATQHLRHTFVPLK